jgi:hypothetical protein
MKFLQVYEYNKMGMSNGGYSTCTEMGCAGNNRISKMK